MSTDEPAWKAELNETLDKRFPFPSFVADRDEIREFVADQVRAAEERGRREAAEAARRTATAMVDTTSALGPNYSAINALVRFADSIDPDVP